MIRGGRPAPHRVVHLAAVSGARHNPDLRRVRARLLAAGKAKKPALTAVAGKLAILADALVGQDGLRQPTPPKPARPTTQMLPRTGSGVRDPGTAEPVRVTSAILPRWARRTSGSDAPLPVLHLRGVSTCDFGEALSARCPTAMPRSDRPLSRAA